MNRHVTALAALVALAMPQTQTRVSIPITHGWQSSGYQPPRPRLRLAHKPKVRKESAKGRRRRLTKAARQASVHTRMGGR